MALNLRANTAVDVLIGPFVDLTDGATAEEGESPTVLLSKNGQALGAKSDATVPVADDAGYYNCELDTTDTNTEGTLVLIVEKSANALPVRHEYNVLSEAAWDSLYVAKDDGFMDVNVKTIGRADTQETEAGNLETACANYSATRGLAGTALPAAAADAVGGLPISDAGGLDMDAILTRIGTPTNLGGGTATLAGNLQDIEAQTDDIGVAGAGLTALGDARLANLDATVSSRSSHSAADGADAVWDELLTGATHNIATSAGRRLRQLGDVMAGTVDDVAATTTEFDTDLTAADDFYNDQILLFTSGALAGQARPILAFANTGGRITLDEPLVAPPANGDGFDILPQHIHPISQIQAGLSTLDAADVRTAVGLASANLDTQLGDIPTVAEFNARTLVAANYATYAAQTTAQAVLTKLDTTMVQDGSVYDFTAAALAAAPSGTGASAATIADAVWDEARAGHVAAGSFGEGVLLANAAMGGTSLVLTMGQLRINSSSADGAIDIDNSGGDGINIRSTVGHGIQTVSVAGAGVGLYAIGPLSGIFASGYARGFSCYATDTNGIGADFVGHDGGYGLRLGIGGVGTGTDLYLASDSGAGTTNLLNTIKGAGWSGATDTLEEIRDAIDGVGGGGDATVANQTIIINHLTDIKGTGFVKDTDSLVNLAHTGADSDTLETLSDQIDGIGAGGTVNVEMKTTETRMGSS